MTFSLSADLFRNLELSVVSDVLNPFANCQRKDIKVAVDANDRMIGRYTRNVRAEFADVFNYWLTLMTRNQEPRFEVLDIDLTTVKEDEYCLKVASAINGSRSLITSSLQSFKYKLNNQDEVFYDGQLIKVIDANKAKSVVNTLSGNNINVSNSTNTTININSNNNISV